MPFDVKDITVLITNFYLFLFNLWKKIIKTPTAPSKVVQHNEVGKCVVQIVAVGWIVQRCPILGQRRVLIQHQVLRLGLIIYRIKARHLWTAKRGIPCLF